MTDALLAMFGDESKPNKVSLIFKFCFSKAYSSISKAGSNVTSYIKSHPRTTLVVLSGIVSFVASFILTKQVSPTAFCDVIGKRTDLFFNGKPILVHKGKMYFCK